MIEMFYPVEYNVFVKISLLLRMVQNSLNISDSKPWLAQSMGKLSMPDSENLIK